MNVYYNILGKEGQNDQGLRDLRKKHRLQRKVSI